MGNPLGPTLANAFLAHHESTWLNECPVNFKPLVYRRYVDDTFLIFRCADHIPKFLDYVNSKHPNIEFTSETELNGKLAFLDVSVSHDNHGTFKTSVYRKPTFTGLTTKFTSFIPIQFKRNLVSTLATRAYNICSNYLSLNSEFQYLKECLVHNGFSRGFIDSYIGKQLQKLRHPKPPKITVNRAIVYFPITFMGKSSFSLKNKLTRLMKEFYPQLNTRVIFRSKQVMKNLFKFKDAIPPELRSSVVYKYQCGFCSASYIGKSKRQYRVRIFEHLGRSIRTNRQLSTPSFSSIRQHSESCDHPINSDSFSIIASRSNTMELCVTETLLSIRDKPSLCSNERSVELLCF